MTAYERYTTRLAARVLGRKREEALSLLKAANIPNIRLGRRGTVLWDADAVNSLCAVLKEREVAQHDQ